MPALALMLFAAVFALVPVGGPQKRSKISAGMGVVSAGFGLMSCLNVLIGQTVGTFSAQWHIPCGSFSLRLDALSAFFLLPILGLGSLAAIYGVKYLIHATDEKNLGMSWFCFYILWMSMVIVVLAANGLLFLIAWEVTVLSSFLLVVLGSDSENNRRAGWIYFTASHLGTAFLIILFLWLGRETGSLDFEGFSRAAALPTALKGMMFLLAVIGFGTKAGFVPFHVWLPEAHPAAPSHVSALMSGVMIKTGIYGLVRTLFFLGTPSLWWGWTLVIIGLTSGILGVLFAISQHDLKRLLAYHSVENIGIIALGLGLGLLGLRLENLSVAAFGFAGGLLHVLNHAVFKGLLFLGAGAVLEQTGTRNIDRLGGLLKRMPWTGTSFLVGCLSICGLPPFNGFISEFLIYFGAFLAVLSGTDQLIASGLLIIVGLSFIGGLAAACFTKAFSVVFLGSPRSIQAAEAHEVSLWMKAPMAVLAALCALIALVSPFLLNFLGEVLRGHPNFSTGVNLPLLLGQAFTPLFAITGCSFVLLALLGFVMAWRRSLQADRKIEDSVTWDCGYAQPSAGMQYTGSSFAQPLTELFHIVLRTKIHLNGVEGYFPQKATFQTHTTDVFHEGLFKPLFRWLSALLHRMTWIQNGVVQVYILYIALTLIVLLIGGLM